MIEIFTRNSGAKMLVSKISIGFLIISVVLFVPFRRVHAQPAELATFRLLYMSPSNIRELEDHPVYQKTAEIEQTFIGGSFTIPVIIEPRNKFFMITPSYNANRIELDTKGNSLVVNKNPNQVLKQIGVRLNYVYIHSPEWIFTAGMSPSLNTSSTKRSEFSDITYMGFFQAMHPLSPGKRIGYGISISDAFGYYLPLPMISFTLRRPSYRFSLIFPFLMNYIRTPSDSFEYGIRTGIEGGNYALKHDIFTEETRIRFSQLKLGLAISKKLHNLIWLELDGGVSAFFRDYKFVDEDANTIADFSLNEGLFIETRLVLKMPQGK